MPNTSNAVAADKDAAKTAADKGGEKAVEKRRALGRGLESLLPGPRVVAPVSPPAQVERAEGFPGGAPANASSPLSSSSSSFLSSSGTDPAAAAPSATLVALQGAASPVTDGEQVLQLDVDRIDENPYQTRRVYEEAALQELADSIRSQGLLQPIVARPGNDGRFTLILGERRLRAARRAGMTEIPAILKRVSDQQAAEMTVVENLQRQDLNCVEQAQAFADLSRIFHLTQEQIGARVGVSRETVSNYLRLLTLSEGIIGALQKGTLTYSHARVLLMVSDPNHRWKIAQKAIEEKISVAKLEDLVYGVSMPGGSVPEKSEGGGARWLDPNVKAAQRSLEAVLGMRVRIRDRNGRGKIQIEYSTIEDFERVVRMLRGK